MRRTDTFAKRELQTVRGLPRDKGARDNPLAPGSGETGAQADRKGRDHQSRASGFRGEGTKRAGVRLGGMIRLPLVSAADRGLIDILNLGREAGIALTRSCHLCEAADLRSR